MLKPSYLLSPNCASQNWLFQSYFSTGPGLQETKGTVLHKTADAMYPDSKISTQLPAYLFLPAPMKLPIVLGTDMCHA